MSRASLPGGQFTWEMKYNKLIIPKTVKSEMVPFYIRDSTILHYYSKAPTQMETCNKLSKQLANTIKIVQYIETQTRSVFHS